MYSVGAALYAHIPHLSMSQCQALVQTLEEKSGHKLLQDPAAGTVPDDAATIDKCNGTRTELQRVFNETWNNLAKLIKDGEELADKELKACRVAAETEHEEKMDAYEDKVGMATTNINAATQTLNQLSSLLKNSQTEATLLQDYLSTIKADCTIQGDVSEHMEAVLKMIHVLEDCPGRNDFRLIIPGSLTDRIGIGSDTPSPTPEGWEG